MFCKGFAGSSRTTRPIGRPAIIETLEARRLLTALAPGGSAYLSGTTLAARPELAGTVIYDHSSPFSAKNYYGTIASQGTLHEQVVRETKTGTLDFYHSIACDPSSGGYFRVDGEGSFSGFRTDVEYRTDLGGTVRPTWAGRSYDGKSVDLDFFSSLGGGQQTVCYFVKTDATQFDTNGSTSLSFGYPQFRGLGFFASLAIAEPTGTPASAATLPSASATVTNSLIAPSSPLSTLGTPSVNRSRHSDLSLLDVKSDRDVLSDVG